MFSKSLSMDNVLGDLCCCSFINLVMGQFLLLTNGELVEDLLLGHPSLATGQHVPRFMKRDEGGLVPAVDEVRAKEMPFVSQDLLHFPEIGASGCCESPADDLNGSAPEDLSGKINQLVKIIML